MKYSIFKNELSNWNDYHKDVILLQEKIDDIIYEYFGVKAVDYSKDRTSYNNNLSEQKRYKMMKKLELPQKQLDYTLSAIENIKRNVARLPYWVREIVVLLFIHNYTYQEVADMYGYSKGGLYKVVRKEIEKI